MPLTFAAPTEPSVPVYILRAEEPVALELTQPQSRWLEATGFSGKLGEVALIPGEAGIEAVLVGWGDAAARSRDRFHLAVAAAKLPAGSYRIAAGLAAEDRATEAYGWLLSGYQFTRYKGSPKPAARLVAPEGVDASRLETIATSEALVRDLINTPASDMGPHALEQAVRAVGKQFGAEVSAVTGTELLAQNFPMIHAVGRASDQEPRLLELRWGRPDAPKVALVGKGVCFDTGGLDIKPAASMALMKKDMGGAATMLGLARMIMALNLDLNLRLLIPAVENSISAGAFRPGDILTSRKGLTVEINNTDAEGRLVLADALAAADEEAPRLLVCAATLTGAARVALGPDLMPFFTDDIAFAQALVAASREEADPLWQMPFWQPYEPLIEPGFADLDNAPSGGMAGSITAALFLRRFTEAATTFAHFDIYGWTQGDKPARPKGAACQAARAILAAIEREICPAEAGGPNKTSTRG